MYSSCTYLSESCPVSATAYGYIPNFAANVFFDTLFGLLLVTNILIPIVPPKIDGKRQRHWVFSTFAFFGTTFSFLGFLSRIWLNGDVWITAAVAVELITNIIAPTMLLGGIYLVVEPTINHIGAEYSRLPARFYTWILHSSNALSIVLECVGGGVAASAGASRDSSTGTMGVDLILAGLALQIVTMLTLAGLVIDYILNWRQSKAVNSIEASKSDEEQSPPTTNKRLLWFVRLMALAYTLVFVRCIYRVVEMAGGWGNSVMQNEPAFFVFEGAFLFLAWVCVTAAHPAFLFPTMRIRSKSELV